MPGKPPLPEPLSLTGAREINEHLEEILNSGLFRRTSSLNHLLSYLVSKLLEGEGEPLKEAVIAMDVFHRTGAFDSRLDNIVRVHAYRLRKLLDAYYEKETPASNLRFVIPKGMYNLHVETRELAVFDEAVPVLEPPLTVPVRRKLPLQLAAGVLCGFLAGAAAAWGVLSHLPAKPAGLLAPPLVSLWGGIFRPGIGCVVSFTNPAFLFTDTGGSRAYFTYHGPITSTSGSPIELPPKDPLLKFGNSFRFSNSWTGTGELLAIHRLTDLASQAGYPLTVIRSRALKYNDIKSSNVIFLGSPWANEMQSKFNIGLTPFVCISNEKILNNDPRPGEARSFTSILDPASRQITATYALFSILPGAGPGTKFVSASGINTDGTMAALELMTSARGVEALAQRLGKPSLPPYFQAVVRAEIMKGDPLNASIVTARELHFQ